MVYVLDQIERVESCLGCIFVQEEVGEGDVVCVEFVVDVVRAELVELVLWHCVIYEECEDVDEDGVQEQAGRYLAFVLVKSRSCCSKERNVETDLQDK